MNLFWNMRKSRLLNVRKTFLKAEAIIDNARAFINSLDPVFFDADNKDKDWKTIINFYRQISPGVASDRHGWPRQKRKGWTTLFQQHCNR